MMTSSEIRQQFLDFFASKGHVIVPSAPIVVKNDPTLMFTNAGMNQFKDYFLGNKPAPNKRVVDTQKCLRVSGKHNDLEEVGVDTYHHTMFEMLGNWSFGDYFKKEAIQWSWELLTKVYGLDKDRLYVTIFEGDEKEGLPRDEEAYNEWKKWIAEDRIIMGNKKDNFWEMGDTGPCGPCTEIHFDSRPNANNDGHSLVNNDETGTVMEIWNNVFIQFNRSKNGSLEPLPAKHVDTGMGLERLVKVIQGKTSNYDTDVFTGIIAATSKKVNKVYKAGDDKESIAFRVIADHIRAIAFTIADGQLPSNTGAGYVIRRILRRAVRYYYSAAYLDYKKPLLFELIPVLAKQFENVFPELNKQVDFVTKVVKEEEDAFLVTVDKAIIKLTQISNDAFVEGLAKNLIANNYQVLNQNDNKNQAFDLLINTSNGKKIAIEINPGEINKKELVAKATAANIPTVYFINSDKGIKDNPELNDLVKNLNIQGMDYEAFSINGKDSFELYDTYGFPIDLTRLIAQERDLSVDEAGFTKEMQQQKQRSRAATVVDTEDWIVLDDYARNEFIGYDELESQTKVVKYRKVKAKGKEAYQLVLEVTPFYAESGGQVGDTGELIINNEKLKITDTKKDNDLIIHFTDSIPADLSGEVIAKVDATKRKHTELHHSATHLVHAALRKVLGTHVMQKGSLVNDEHLRFDFSHFAKVTDEEMATIETLVNKKIRENIPVVIKEMPKDEAMKLGAMALFGEKYGGVVRVVIIDPTYSVELCGGTHVSSTGELGLFKITHETAVAAGVRRIEAVCGSAAEEYINEKLVELNSIKEQFKNPKDLLKTIESSLTENASLKKQLESIENRMLVGIRNELLQKDEIINGISFIGDIVEVRNPDALKKLCFDLKNNLNNYVVVLCANIGGKPSVAVSIDEKTVAAKNLDAGKIIKEVVAPIINGGGGGQKTLATAGGQDASNLQKVIDTIKNLLK
jgi:alanyl-tRNA synthetase